jgi:hypothetical protein
MRVWHLPARRLPVIARPIAGETIPSYARRLGAVNGLPGTTMLRALGEFTGRSSGTHLLTGFEARLNEQAAARLEEYTGRPGDLLARVLPGLRGGGGWGTVLPPDRPALCFYVAHTRLACRRCQLAGSGPSGPDALILPGWTPLVCHRHRRWLGRDHETAQHNLSAVPDVIAASRRLAGILARSGDRRWAWGEFAHAWNLTRRWPEAGVQHMPALLRRWRERAAAFGVPVFTADKAGSISSAVVAFPEAVALTAVITDLSLRRHVAMEWDIKPFHQRIDASLGERAKPGWDYNDPAHRWARAHRHRFEALRYSSWRTPLLPPERFK